LIQLPIVAVASLLSFLMVGSYKGIIRHTGVKDSISVFFASVLILGFLSASVLINRQYFIAQEFTIPLSILAIHFLLNIVILIASRFLYKEVYNYLVLGSKVEKRVLIYGAGEAGVILYSVLKEDDNKVAIEGFIDDDRKKSRLKLNGLPVLATKKITKKFVEAKGIDEIIISVQRIEPSRLLQIVEKLSKLPLKVKIVPPVSSWIEGDLNAKQIKAVKIEDLLGRRPIDLNNSVLYNEFNNQSIFITGAAGSIGSEISRQLLKFNFKKLVLIDQAESDLYNLQQEINGRENVEAIVADIRNIKRMEELFEKYQPTLLFHAAAYKHVPFMEENPYEAVTTNIGGTKNMADLAVKFQLKKFVMVSTDKAVNPTNIMGASKRIAEMYISCLSSTKTTKFVTTRFGNVLGSNGSVIPLFKSQIERGGPVTVTHKDITRYFMTIPEACQLVLEAGSMGKGGEIFVFDMGQSIKIFDLALNMIRLSGLNYPKDIDIKITGLRPGEKIYEELLANEENTLPTHHQKIMIAKVKDIAISTVKESIDELCIYSNEWTIKEIVLKMKKIVPEFISNNSTFEVLDN
jgi:FlaA1/EpsC-like NDP-sugar epimerase